MPKLAARAKLDKKVPCERSRKAAASANQEFQELQLLYSSASSQSSDSDLRNLKQDSFPVVSNWSQEKCVRTLIEFEVLSSRTPTCWSCLEPMSRDSRTRDSAFHCATPGCYHHPCVTCPREAWTPLHSQARQGMAVDYINFLRTCFCVGCKMPPDSLPHFVDGPGRNRVTAWARDIRMALATAEYVDSQEMVFDSGILEFDTASTQVQRKTTPQEVAAAQRHRSTFESRVASRLGQRGRTMLKRPAGASTAGVRRTIHKGRHLLFKIRPTESGAAASSKTYAVVPLPAKVASAGFAAGAESFLETAEAVKSKLRQGKHVAACDGSRALHKAAQSASVPTLPGVSHLRFIFTPLSLVPKKGLNADSLSLLRAMTKKGVAQEKRHGFYLCGGDNVAEAIASVSKGQLRRQNLLGRGKIHGHDHTNVLAAHYLNKGAGVFRVLRALAIHRRKAAEGLLSPSEAFSKPLWLR